MRSAKDNCLQVRKYDRGLHHTMRYKLHWLDMT